ncbi:MAG: helix-turn-helix domain-containing protein [Burkholderiaceae bacterium]
MSSVGDRIRERRIELKWTQETLATKAGISKGFLSDVETGKRNVSAENLLCIAQELGVSLDFLMKGGQSTPKSGEIQIPASLAEFGRLANLPFQHILKLLEMGRQIKAHRSATHSDDLEKFDWPRFYEAVKGFLK